MKLLLFEGCLRNRKALCRELALPDGAEEAAVIEAGYRPRTTARPPALKEHAFQDSAVSGRAVFPSLFPSGL